MQYADCVQYRYNATASSLEQEYIHALTLQLLALQLRQGSCDEAPKAKLFLATKHNNGSSSRI